MSSVEDLNHRLDVAKTKLDEGQDRVMEAIPHRRHLAALLGGMLQTVDKLPHGVLRESLENVRGQAAAAAGPVTEGRDIANRALSGSGQYLTKQIVANANQAVDMLTGGDRGVHQRAALLEARLANIEGLAKGLRKGIEDAALFCESLGSSLFELTGVMEERGDNNRACLVEVVDPNRGPGLINNAMAGIDNYQQGHLGYRG